MKRSVKELSGGEIDTVILKEMVQDVLNEAISDLVTKSLKKMHFKKLKQFYDYLSEQPIENSKSKQMVAATKKIGNVH